MKIQVTEYTREDGVAMIRHNGSNRWIIRSIYGPSWFWNKTDSEWVCVTIMSCEEWNSMYNEDSNFAVSEDEGLKLLDRIPKKVT